MSIRRISPNESHELITRDGYVYLDVRSTGEFEQGHPADSYNVPVAQPGAGGMAPNPEFVAVMLAAFARDAKLVVGCQSGNRSQRACAALAAAGFSNLVEQRAGWGGVRDAFGVVSEPGWLAAGLPAASGPDPARGYAAMRAKLG